MQTFEAPNYSYKCDVIRVVDGDTVDVDVDLGMYTKVRKRLRFLDVDTYELRGGTDETKQLAREATSRLRELCEQSTQCYIMSKMDTEGKYGRLLAWLFVTIDGKVINTSQTLIDEGYQKQ